MKQDWKIGWQILHTGQKRLRNSFESFLSKSFAAFVVDSNRWMSSEHFQFRGKAWWEEMREGRGLAENYIILLNFIRAMTKYFLPGLMKSSFCNCKVLWSFVIFVLNCWVQKVAHCLKLLQPAILNVFWQFMSGCVMSLLVERWRWGYHWEFLLTRSISGSNHRLPSHS